MAKKSLSKILGKASLDILRTLTSKHKILKIHRKKYGLAKEKTNKLWNMYLEYMVIKARYMDFGTKMEFSTSPEVDKMWHTHLLNTYVPIKFYPLNFAEI